MARIFLEPISIRLWVSIAALSMAWPCACAAEADMWVLRGSKVYIAPDVAPIADGVVLVRGHKIAQVGAKSAVRIPAGARESECSGGVLAAGFQNSHVHFTGDQWNDAGKQAADDLSRNLATMLTRYGYSTVVDTASNRDNTLALRARIEKVEVRGPRVLTVGLPLFPPDGIPVYLAHFPKALLDLMPQPTTAVDGVKVVQENMKAGVDGTKLFVATPTGHNTIKRMPADIARAAADETHRHGKLVMAHPTDIEGVRAALAAGVDILVHTTLGVETPWPDDLRRDVIARHMSVVPTLKLLGYELKKQQVPAGVSQHLIDVSVEHVRTFAAAGGQVLFGTDVGYMTDFDPAEEYVLMSKAGLTPMQILASLTTSPAARWNEADRRGRLAKGMDADIVVLDADPAAEPSNFARVRCTISRGRTIYAAQP